jgi:hypothetical protein
VFGSLGWTSRPYLTGIEDQYLISLQPSIIARLTPAFAANNIHSQIEKTLPDNVYSVTSYNLANPAAAWVSLKTAVSSEVDALSTIVFSSLLKSALLSYGIDDPELFLSAVKGEILTIRLDETAERSMLIAGVRDRADLRQLLSKGKSVISRNDDQKLEIFEDQHGDFAASLSDEFIVIGSPADVRHYSALQVADKSMSAEKVRRMTFFRSSPASGTVVTYTDDGDRVRSFISAILLAKDGKTQPPQLLDEAIASLPYSSTETTFGERGLERTTRSPLGQFSTLVSLLFPSQPGR